VSEEISPYQPLDPIKSLRPDKLSALFQVLMHDYFSSSQSDKERELCALGLLKIVNDRCDDLFNSYIEKFMVECEKWIIETTGLNDHEYFKKWLQMAPLLVGYDSCNNQFRYIRHCIINLDHHQLGLRTYYSSILFLLKTSHYEKWKTEISLTVESNLKANHGCNEEGLYLLSKIIDRGELHQLCNRWKFYNTNTLDKKLSESDLKYIEDILSDCIEVPKSFEDLYVSINKLFRDRLMVICG